MFLRQLVLLLSHLTQSPKATTRYYKIPYIGRFSTVAQTKLRLLVDYYYTDLDIKLALSTFKVRHNFSVKDSVTQGLRWRVIYNFLCAGCNASYIGETTRHFSTRVREHFVSDKALSCLQTHCLISSLQRFLFYGMFRYP